MKVLATVILSSFFGLASAQYYYDKLYSLSLDMNQPLSNTEFLETFSSSGGRFAFNSFVSENFSGGLDLSWNRYVQTDPRQTYYSPGGAFTAEYHKYIITYGLALKVGYYLKPSQRFTPFFNINLGASNVDYKLYYNIYSDGESAWGFLGRPEAGVMWRLGQHSSWGLQATVHYLWIGAKSDLFDYKNFSTLGLSIGVVSLDW